MKNVLNSPARFWALSATALLALTTLANAQFYVGGQVSGLISKVETNGTPSTFANFGAGNDVEGITTDGSGNVYVAVNSTIQRITPGGSVSQFGTYSDPIGGLTFNGGTLYGVTTSGGPSGGNNVGTFTAGSFTPLTLTNPGFAPFFQSNGLKFDSLGNIFVTNVSNGGTYGESVLKLTPTGSDYTISAFVSYATGSFKPYDVEIDSLGNVYVSSSASTDILKYNAAGTLDPTFTLSGTTGGVFASGLALANGNLYAGVYGTFRLYEVNTTTGAATVFQNPGSLSDFRSTFVTYTAVPEPSQVSMMVLGALALIGVTIYRKKARGVC